MNYKSIHTVHTLHATIDDQFCPPRHVLVVDDEQTMVTLVRIMLESLGFQVDTALSGGKAIGCMEKHSYDLVVTDLQMPKMTGTDLARWIKHNHNETKVVIMTGDTSINTHDNLRLWNVDFFMIKPFSIEEIRSVVTDLCF